MQQKESPEISSHKYSQYTVDKEANPKQWDKVNFFNKWCWNNWAVQFSSVAQSCSTLATPCTAACQASLSFINSWSLLKLMSIESVMPSNHLICCYPLPLPSSILPSIRVFSNESVLHISTGVSASASVQLPVNIQDWFPLRLTGWISWQSKGLSRVFSDTTVQKYPFFSTELSL